ncbi:hypothetical protein ACFPRL_03335 [Pseudoclavibacter helvolus]
MLSGAAEPGLLTRSRTPDTSGIDCSCSCTAAPTNPVAPVRSTFMPPPALYRSDQRICRKPRVPAPDDGRALTSLIHEALAPRPDSRAVPRHGLRAACRRARGARTPCCEALTGGAGLRCAPGRTRGDARRHGRSATPVHGGVRPASAS